MHSEITMHHLNALTIAKYSVPSEVLRAANALGPYAAVHGPSVDCDYSREDAEL
jgi:hypothetical protein